MRFAQFRQEHQILADTGVAFVRRSGWGTGGALLPLDPQHKREINGAALFTLGDGLEPAPDERTQDPRRPVEDLFRFGCPR
jgi:hypothetical protein